MGRRRGHRDHPDAGVGGLGVHVYLPTFFGAARSVPFCQAWNLAGLPALSVPVGLRDGLPLAVQLIGGSGSERTLLGAAAQIEEVHLPALQ